LLINFCIYFLKTYIQAHYSKQDPYLREQILEMITEDGLQPELKTYETYIESLLIGEEYERAFEFFDSLKSKNIYPSQEFYTAMIRKAISIYESGRALKLLKDLEQNQLMHIPNSLYNDVLRFCAYEYHVSKIIYSSVRVFIGKLLK
jgi:pentatricopeptide repeat protein